METRLDHNAKIRLRLGGESNPKMIEAAKKVAAKDDKGKSKGKNKMPTQQTSYTPSAPPPVRLKKGASLPSARRAPWAPLPDEDEETPERGERAVLHDQGIKRGRRSRDFPDLNISATAEALGVTKSYLAKVLSGYYQPSMSLALRLCEVLGKDLNYVVSLYKGDRRSKD